MKAVPKILHLITYTLTFSAGLALFLFSGLRIVSGAVAYGIGRGPEPWSSLSYLGLMVGFALAAGTVRHWLRSKID